MAEPKDDPIAEARTLGLDESPSPPYRTGGLSLRVAGSSVFLTHPLPAEDSNRATFSHHYGGDGRVANGRARTDYNVNFAFGAGFFATRRSD